MKKLNNRLVWRLNKVHHMEQVSALIIVISVILERVCQYRNHHSKVVIDRNQSIQIHYSMNQKITKFTQFNYDLIMIKIYDI